MMEQAASVEAYIDAAVERAEPSRGGVKGKKFQMAQEQGDDAKKSGVRSSTLVKGKTAHQVPGAQAVRNDEVDPNTKAKCIGGPSLSLAAGFATDQSGSTELRVKADDGNAKKKKANRISTAYKIKKEQEKLHEVADPQTESSSTPALRKTVVGHVSAASGFVNNAYGDDIENQKGHANNDKVTAPAVPEEQIVNAAASGTIYKKVVHAGGESFDGGSSEKFTPMAIPISAKLAIEDKYDDSDLAKQRGGPIAVIEATPDDDSWLGKLLRDRKVQAVLGALVLGLIAALVVAFTVDGNPGHTPPSESEREDQTLYYQVGDTLDGDLSSQYGLSVSTNFDGSRVAVADFEKVQVLEIVQVEDLDSQGENQEVKDAATSSTMYEYVVLGSSIQDTAEIGDSVTTPNQAATALPFRSPLITEMSSSGRFVAVGWPLHTDIDSGLSNVGKVQVYQLIHEQQGNSYSWQAVGNSLIGVLKENGYFGASLSLSDDGGILAVGAPGAPGEAGNGYVQVYYLNKGVWEPRGNSVSGSDLDLSVYSVSLSGDGSSIALGGIPTAKDGAVAKVFSWYAGDWVEQGTGIGQTIGDTSYLAELSSDGKTVVVSNYYITDADSNTGMGLDVRAFKWMEDLRDWQPLGSNMHANYESEKSGYFITLSKDGTRIGMGDPGRRNGSAGATGHAHIWEYDGYDWNQIGENIWGSAAGDQFGYSVAISGDGERLVVGAPYNRGKGQERGRVVVYEVNEDRWKGID